MSLLSARDLVVEYHGNPGIFRRGHVTRAVDGVSFDLKERETLALVGESGCGKSTLARAIVQLLKPSGGRVLLDGKDLREQDPRATRRRMQMVFQDPYSSLNPRMTAAQIITEPLLNFGVIRRRDVPSRAAKLLELVGLPAEHAARYPHEFSGGQRQRLGLARALALEPAILICDEPVSALDVSVQAQIINLLADLRGRLGLSLLFISHDLAVVRHLADRVAVMQRGKIVELNDNDAIFRSPSHPYTRALLDAVPEPTFS